MNDKILRIENLTCVFNEKQENELVAINNFSFEFEKNKIYFIIGNSGSGKSTLVTHFNGLLKSKKGNIYVKDFRILEKNKKIKNTKKLRRIVSMVFQFPEYQLFKTTIEKDISFGPIALGIPKDRSYQLNLKLTKMNLFKLNWDEIKKYFDIQNNYENFDECLKQENIDAKIKIKEYKNFAKVVLEKKGKKWKKELSLEFITAEEFAQQISKKYLLKLGLDESFLDRSPFELSGGQKRRVAIAGILSIEPEILIFDEPTAGLDPQGEHEMMKIISDAKKNGQTIFVITHTMDQVLEVGDYVLVMDKGKIKYHGTPYEVFTNQELYKASKMEKPKIIEIIDELSNKDKRFKKLYDLQPKTVNQLVDFIKEIVE